MMAVNKFNIYIFLTYILVAAAFTPPKMNMKQCLVKDNMITSIIKISLKQCVQECKMRIACLSLNYRRLHLLCELFFIHDGTFVTNSGKTGPCVHILRFDIAEPKDFTHCSCTNQQTCLPERGSCEAKECTNLEIPNVVIYGNMKNVGARVQIQCASVLNVEETGRTSIQCQSNGTWDYEPKCVSRYMGCYDIYQYDFFMNNYVTLDSQTLEKCINHCHLYNYAAPENSVYCFCGNTLDESRKRSEENCQSICPGNDSQKCGGYWHVSIYKLK